MDVESNKVTWTVLIIAGLAIIGSLLVSTFFPNLMDSVSDTLAGKSQIVKNSVSSNLTTKDTLLMYQQYMKDYSKTYNNTMYINTTDSSSTLRSLSESQGYGMVFTALVGKQSDYDKLLLFFQNHQYSNTGLMSWEINMNSNSALDNNATDGDLWIAYSLFRAYDRWNDKKYLVAGKLLASNILKYDYNNETHMLTTGNWAVAGTSSYYVVRTSDILPEFFTEFFNETGDSRWSEINKNALILLQQLSAKTTTGLVPDLVIYKNGVGSLPTVSPLDNSSANYYSYNACRVPLNLAMTQNAAYRVVLDKMLDFFNKQSTIYSGYQLDGSVLASDKYSSQAFIAPIYAGALTNQNKYKNIISNNKLLLNDNNYYSASQTMGATLLNDY